MSRLTQLAYHVFAIGIMSIVPSFAQDNVCHENQAIYEWALAKFIADLPSSGMVTTSSGDITYSTDATESYSHNISQHSIPFQLGLLGGDVIVEVALVMTRKFVNGRTDYGMVFVTYLRNNSLHKSRRVVSLDNQSDPQYQRYMKFVRDKLKTDIMKAVKRNDHNH